MSKAKAYSYLRFSTPEQMKGNSFDRQIAASRQYAEQHDLDLDETLTFHDLGVSAYRGRNVREGALAIFMDAVDTGRVKKGSYLLVESFDRLSRMKPNEAFTSFNSILNRDINVVTLTDGKAYTKESLGENFADLMISLATMYRAYEESATKSKRLSAAWSKKRERVAEGDGSKLTGRCPAWLTLDKDADEFRTIPERATVVQRIFDLTLDGIGKTNIARCLNAEGVPTFGRSNGWHPSYVQKILDNEAVIGTFQPMTLETRNDGRKVRVPGGDALEGYFPAVVDQATFLRARQVRQDRKIASGRKGSRLSNLFTGLAHCGGCGSPLHFVNKGNDDIYLVCSSARRKVGNCGYRAWRYEPVEEFILDGVLEVDYRQLHPVVYEAATKAMADLEERRLTLENSLGKIGTDLENLTEALALRPTSETLLTKLDKLEADKLAAEEALATTRASYEDAQALRDNTERDHLEVHDALARWKEQSTALDQDEAFIARSRMASLLRKTLDRIELHPADPWEPRKGTVGAIKIVFRDALVTRWVAVEADYRGATSIKFDGDTMAETGSFGFGEQPWSDDE